VPNHKAKSIPFAPSVLAVQVDFSWNYVFYFPIGLTR